MRLENSIRFRIASSFSAMVVSREYVLTTGASNPSSWVGIFRFSCFGTMTSPIPKSIPKGVLVFLILATTVAPTPAYFLVTAIGATLLISKVTKSFSLGTAIISSSTAFTCSGVLGILRSRKSTSTVTRLSKSVTAYTNSPPFRTKLSAYLDFSRRRRNSSWQKSCRHSW